jgi:DNA uptake protein ComE-like DNA-binding protein
MMRLVRWLTVWILALACGALPGAGGVLAEQATKPPAARTTSLIDLNTATREQLMELPGMGKVYADRVIRGRPYSAKNQLTQRGILPLAAYEKIKDLVIARHAP